MTTAMKNSKKVTQKIVFLLGTSLKSAKTKKCQKKKLQNNVIFLGLFGHYIDQKKKNWRKNWSKISQKSEI